MQNLHSFLARPNYNARKIQQTSSPIYDCHCTAVVTERSRYFVDVERGNDEESSNHSHPPILYTQKLNKRPFTYSIGGAPFKTFISLNRWMNKKQSRQKFENIKQIKQMDMRA